MVESKSTDKLKVLMENLFVNVPQPRMEKLKSFRITWKEVDDVIVPFVDLSFYE